MEPVIGDFERALRRVQFRPLRLPLVSGLTGAALEAGAWVGADFWVSHAREPVRFDAAMRTLAERGCELFVELGPDAPLLNMGRRCLPGATVSLAAFTPAGAERLARAPRQPGGALRTGRGG